ncbi:MAG: hypothetical protein JWR61_4733 [Ferruginibacter sp.]|nr:hypothetical protein [Ferruginibacter sp.]
MVYKMLLITLVSISLEVAFAFEKFSISMSCNRLSQPIPAIGNQKSAIL